MDSIRTYILSMVASAILCCILTRLTDTKGSVGTLFHLICGLFLVFTMIAPITSVNPTDISGMISEFALDGNRYTKSGRAEYRSALADVIKQQTEAYIMDKAHEMDAAVQVEIHLTAGEPPVPDGVTLRGTVSPNVKAKLQYMIEAELGIEEECQTWIEQQSQKES